MTNKGNTTNRPLLWEDDPAAELRPRRARDDSSISGQFRPPAAGRRGGPGLPLEFEDPDGDGILRPSKDRFAGAKTSWRRPATTMGRVLLGIGVVLAFGSVTAGYLTAKHYLERDARFRVAGTGAIQASGLTEVPRAQLLSVFGEDIGRNIFFVPIRQRQKQLEQIPWVERATVMRILPDQIRISLVERTPVAFTRQGQQIGLVDANGVLLNMSPTTMAKHHYSFPVLTGIDSGDTPSSRKGRMALYMRLMTDLDSGGKHDSEQISEIDLTDPEDARVLLPAQGGDILAHFGEDHFLERYQRYQAHIAEWRQLYPHLASVDLRYDSQVVLDMMSGRHAADSVTGANGDSNALNTGDRKPETGVKEKAATRTPSTTAKKSKQVQRKKRAATSGRPGTKRATKRKPALGTRMTTAMMQGG